MDSYQGLKKNKSILFTCKSSGKKFLAGFLLGAFAVACQNSGTKPTILEPKEKEIAPANLEQQIQAAKNSELGVQLTQSGSNNDPFLSSDGKKLLFVSSGRRGHSSKQIYMLDFETMKERRLTFNDGDNSSPIFVEGFNLLAYSSNTDLLKEHPILFYPNTNKDGNDLYISEISGSAIERLTSQDGFKGNLQSSGSKKGIFLYQTQNENKKFIYQMNANNKTTTLLFSFPPQARSMKRSPDQKAWLWLEKKDDKELLHIGPDPSKANNIQNLEIPFDSINDANWMTAKQIIVAGRPSAKIIDPKEKPSNNIATLVDLEKKCLQKLLKSDGTITSPLFDSKNRSIIYSTETSGTSQIYLKKIDLSAIPCQGY